MTAGGRVILVGAGPGDPGLITVKGLDYLRRADVVLYDRLIGHMLLNEALTGAMLIDVGKMPRSSQNPQHDINQQLIEYARAGKLVVRLKGGDPFVFGRGSEEVDVCRAAGIACDVIPGVSSALAAPAAAGIPVTLRGVARHFTVLTAHAETGEIPDYDFDGLAKLDTLVVLMGLRALRPLTRRLIKAGRNADTSAATIASATTPAQRVVTGTLANIADRVDAAGLSSPVVTVVGSVAARADDVAAHAEDIVNRMDEEDRRHHMRALAGRRVVVTQAETTSSNLHRLLHAHGAEIVHCPLIAIATEPMTDSLRNVFDELRDGCFDWLVFTSVHGVRSFWQLLRAAGYDARTVGRARVTALGKGTAAALSEFGLHADLVPIRALATELASELIGRIEEEKLSNPRVLFPRGNLALPTMKDNLTTTGCTVIDPIVYRTHPQALSHEQRARLNDGVDAILFCSPSAVESYARQQIEVGNAIIGCIGPTTADAANELGIRVDIVPREPGSDGLVRALVAHFDALQEVTV